MKRVCSICKIEKELNDINFAKDKYDPVAGLTHNCKVCRNKKAKEYRDSNPEKIRIKNLSAKESRKSFYASEEGILSSRKAHLKRTYGITLEDYNKMAETQDHKCMICGGTEMNYRNKVLCVDHNHETGKIRGLLCGLCNSGIGKFKENEQLLLNAIKYLQQYDK